MHLGHRELIWLEDLSLADKPSMYTLYRGSLCMSRIQDADFGEIAERWLHFSANSSPMPVERVDVRLKDIHGNFPPLDLLPACTRGAYEFELKRLEPHNNDLVSHAEEYAGAPRVEGEPMASVGTLRACDLAIRFGARRPPRLYSRPSVTVTRSPVQAIRWNPGRHSHLPVIR